MPLGTTSIDGLYSGLDTTKIIESLAAIRRRPIDLLTRRIQERQRTLAAYQSLSSQVLALQSAAGSLASGSSLQTRTVTNSDSAAVVASAASGTATGTYELTINRLARAHKLSSGNVADHDAALGFTGDVTINGKTVSLKAEDDLAAFRDAINDAGAGVAASIVTVSDTEHHLVLRSLKTGVENAITMSESAGGGFLASLAFTGLQTPLDAEIELDGYTLTRPGNSIDDAVSGLSLDLLQADPAKPVLITVAANYQATINTVQGLVSSYNAIISTLNAGQRFDSEANTGGLFFAENSILRLQEGLSQKALAPVTTLGGNLTLLSQIGLGSDRYGLLTLDTNKLRKALEDDPAAVTRLLTSQSQATDAEVTVEEAPPGVADSGPAGYAVQVTQVATRATALSGELAGGITQNETLSINGQYQVLLESGSSLQEAADRLNAVFEGNKLRLTASVADNRLQIQSAFYGSSYGINISSSLADGAGGTDLGGAAAGETQTTYGANVAGTIGGKAAKGWGRWLTGEEAGVEGLRLQITGTTTGDRGVVKVSQGLAARLAGYCLQVTDDEDGLLATAQGSLDDAIEDLNESVIKMEQSVLEYTEQMQLKFASVEALMAKNKTIQQYLTGQLAGLQGTKVNQDA